MRVRDRVAIGWLDPGHVDGMFALSIATIYATRHQRVEALIRVESGGLLSRGRNELVALFMDTSEAEWLLMLDSDEQLSVDAFDKLVDAVHDRDRPIVAGLYFMAQKGEYYPSALPAIFNAVPGSSRFLPVVDYPKDRVIPIDSAGTGCLMIHRSVLEKFRADAAPHQGENWCWFMDMPVNGDWYSEDHFFCSRARELGFQLHAHTGAVLPHRKRFWLTDRHYVPPEAAVSDLKRELADALRRGDKQRATEIKARLDATQTREKAVTAPDEKAAS